MARSEAARCRAEYQWLPEATQRLHTLETEGYDSLDFDSKMASGGDRIYAVEWHRKRYQDSVATCLEALKTCPDPKNRMSKRTEQECQHYREMLVKDQERLADLEARGDFAVSAYDLRMGYNAEFNKQLKRNHIVYDLKQIERCPKPLVDVRPAADVISTEAPVPAALSKEERPEPVARQATLFEL